MYHVYISNILQLTMQKINNVTVSVFYCTVTVLLQLTRDLYKADAFTSASFDTVEGLNA